MFKKYHVLLMNIFFTLDIALTLFALYLADQIFPMLSSIDSFGENIYIKGYVYLIVALLWAAIFHLFPTYNSKRAMKITNELIGVIVAVITAWLIFAGGLFVLGILNISRPFLLLFGVLNLGLLIAFHLSLRILLRILRLKGYNLKKVLIISAGSVGQVIAKEILVRPWTGFSIIGFLDDNPALQGQRVLSLPVLGDLDDVQKVVETMELDDEVIIALPPASHHRLEEVIQKIENVPVNIRVIPDFFNLAYIRPNIEEFWGIPLIGIRNSNLAPSVAIVKRLIDIVGAIIGIVLFAPIIMVVACLIKITDPEGPVLFIQKRIGENGNPFKIYKFRTMSVDAEDRLESLISLDDLDEPKYKLKDDPRITGFGRFLRRASLDELPQLYNVLMGDMSLVGPRPESALLVQRYNSWQRKRLMIKPGLTGPAQINGRGDLTLKAIVELEVEYINNYSLLRDFEILIKTIPAVILGKGSY